MSTFWSRGLNVRSRVKILYLTEEDMILKWKTAIVKAWHCIGSHSIACRLWVYFSTRLHRVVDGLISLDEDVAPALRHLDPGRLPARERAAGRHQIQVGRRSPSKSKQWHRLLIYLFESKWYGSSQQYLPLGVCVSRGDHSYHQFHFFYFPFLGALDGFLLRNNAASLILQVESDQGIQMSLPHLDKYLLINTHPEHSRGCDEESACKKTEKERLIASISGKTSAVFCVIDQTATNWNRRWSLPCLTKSNLGIRFAREQYWISCASVLSGVHRPVMWSGLRPPGQGQQQEGKDVELHLCCSFWFSSDPTDVSNSSFVNHPPLNYSILGSWCPPSVFTPRLLV